MDAKRGRVGLFGGSFDPVHNGHLAAARRAREAGGLDEVVFIPAAASPLKVGRMVAPDADRLAMLRLAIADESAFSVSDYEIAKAGVSYTIDTVRHFEAAWPGVRTGCGMTRNKRRFWAVLAGKPDNRTSINKMFTPFLVIWASRLP